MGPQYSTVALYVRDKDNYRVQPPYLCLQRRKDGESRPELTQACSSRWRCQIFSQRCQFSYAHTAYSESSLVGSVSNLDQHDRVCEIGIHGVPYSLLKQFGAMKKPVWIFGPTVVSHFRHYQNYSCLPMTLKHLTRVYHRTTALRSSHHCQPRRWRRA